VKRAIILIGISMICALATGCGSQQDDNQINLEKMNAQEILEVLNTQEYPNDSATMYTEKGSVNGYPWSLQGCTSAVYWTITLGNEGQESSGVIEVFDSVSNCANRKNSAEIISSFHSPEQDYYVQEGVVFMQIPFSLTPDEAAQFEAALKAMAEGKMPEVYTGAKWNTANKWPGYVESFPNYSYEGVLKGSYEDRRFELKEMPQNIAEELVALDFYYNIAGAYDKLYKLCGSESLQISATNTEQNFKEGRYIKEYVITNLATLPMEDFLAIDESILGMIRGDIQSNNLSEYVYVRVDFTMTTPAEQQGYAELSDGDHSFYFLCGKNQVDSEWKLYELYWNE